MLLLGNSICLLWGEGLLLVSVKFVEATCGRRRCLGVACSRWEVRCLQQYGGHMKKPLLDWPFELAVERCFGSSQRGGAGSHYVSLP